MDIQIYAIAFFEDVDIAKDRKSDPILKQLSPSRKPAFVKKIEQFRKEKGIDIKEFLSLCKRFNSAKDRYDKKCKGKYNTYLLPQDYKRYKISPEEKAYWDSHYRLLNWVKSRISPEDINSIITEAKCSPFWSFPILKYILTGVMPNPFRYYNKWRIIPDIKSNLAERKLYIQIYGDTAYMDILEPSSWDFIERNQTMLFKDRKRTASKTAIEPIFDEANNVLKIPIYPDTRQPDIKAVWSKVKKYQSKLVGSKYNKPIKDFEGQLKIVKDVKRGISYEDIVDKDVSLSEKKLKKGVMRVAQQKSRMIKRGYVAKFRKKLTPVKSDWQ